MNGDQYIEFINLAKEVMKDMISLGMSIERSFEILQTMLKVAAKELEGRRV